MRTAAEAALAYLESFAGADPDRIAAFVTDDFVNEHTSALGEGCEGKAEYRRRLPAFLDAFAGLRYEVEEVIAQEDRAAAAYIMRATYEGRPIAVRGVMRFRVHEGLVAHRIDYYDSLDFLRQIGQA
jgi:steroid delta-isomerase-like uncharacterized protein